MALQTKFDSCASKDRDNEQNFLLSDIGETKVHSTEEPFIGSMKVSKITEENNSVALEEVPEPSRIRVGVTMIACLYLIMCSFGMATVLGVIYVDLIAYFDAPRSEAALVQSVYFSFCMGGGVLFSRPLTKYDTGLIIAAASLLATISFCAIAFAPNIEIVILLIGVTGLLVSINVLGALIVTSWMFQKRRKFALATLINGSMVAQIFLPYIVLAAVDTYSWKDAVINLGAVMYLNCIPCGILIHFARPYFHKGDVPKTKRNICVDSSLFSDPIFIIYLMMCLTSAATGLIEKWFVVDMSVLKGFTADAGATLLSLYTVFGLTGSYIGVILLICFPNTQQVIHMAYAFFTSAISNIIISQSQVYWGMALGIITRGLSGGLILSFLPGLQIDIGGLERYPETAAVSHVVGGVGAILGGFFGGLSVDMTKSYDFLFFIASGANTFNTIIMLSIFVISKFKRSRHTYESVK